MVKAAKKSKHHSQLHAAFVFRGGAIISWENNTPKRHAEYNALYGLVVTKNTNILSVRIGKDGKLRNARPCKRCWAYIKFQKIHTVFYSTDEGTIVRERV